MARPLRIEFPGAVYHITARGNEKKKIFLNEGDRRSFFDVLKNVKERFHWEFHTYALMDNHYHLLVETPEANLSRGMRQLNGVYTQEFNRRHKRVGHLFQGRFHSVLIEKDEYLLEVSRYIMLNPVRAGIAAKAEACAWSSYGATIGIRSRPAWLTVDWILSQFGRDKENAVFALKEYVESGAGEKYPVGTRPAGLILGSEEFLRRFRDWSRPKWIGSRSRGCREQSRGPN